MADYPLEFPYRVARITKAHGLKGELSVHFFRFRSIAAVPSALRWRKLKKPIPVEIEFEDEQFVQRHLTHVRWVDPMKATIRLQELSDRTEAERYAGAMLDLDPSHFPPELMDEADHCFGARVINEQGAYLGDVVALRDNGAQALLVIGEDEVLVPFVDQFILEVGSDSEGKFVRINPIPGLLEANT